MKIHIRREPYNTNVQFYLYSDENRVFTTYEIKDGKFIGTSHIRDGSPIDSKPLFTLPEYEAREFFKACAELAEKEGIEKTSETFAKGKLESQSEHLKDLRKLLKL